MAGYLFAFSDEKQLFDSIAKGSYSTLVNYKWSKEVASTLGDYVTMEKGDNVYFFSNKTIYGIGEIVEVNEDIAAFENYRGASCGTEIKYAVIKNESIVTKPYLINKGADGKNKGRVKRWAIVFKPSPLFFATGIDMDDLLMSNPQAFRSLRVFERRSFIKLDEEENQAFKAAILRRNLAALYKPNKSNVLKCDHVKTLRKYEKKIGRRSINLDIPGLLSHSRAEDGSLTSEMHVEVGLLYQLARHDTETEKVFGSWHYLNHQVAASPMKPTLWMDRIDILAFRYIEKYHPIVESYGVIELKKGIVTGDDIQQVMKYVDWINKEYGTGDYSLIDAFLVGYKFDMESIAQLDKTAERRFIIGRPARPAIWHDLTYVTYYVDEDGHITFKKVDIE